MLRLPSALFVRKRRVTAWMFVLVSFLGIFRFEAVEKKTLFGIEPFCGVSTTCSVILLCGSFHLLVESDC